MRASAGYPEASDGFIGRWFDVSEIGGLVRLLLAIFVLFSCGASLAIATLRPDLAERTASIEAEFAKLWPESRIARVANDGEALLALYGVTRVCAQLARREIACEVTIKAWLAVKESVGDGPVLRGRLVGAAIARVGKGDASAFRAPADREQGAGT